MGFSIGYGHSLCPEQTGEHRLLLQAHVEEGAEAGPDASPGPATYWLRMQRLSRAIRPKKRSRRLQMMLSLRHTRRHVRESMEMKHRFPSMSVDFPDATN